ncbi:MAG: FtsX-like permease family protein [Candidatus Thorarchaeota archaeon]
MTRERWRTILLVGGIIITVGLEAGIAISVDSLYEDFIGSHRGRNLTDITLHPKNNATLNEIKEKMDTIAQVAGVRKVSPVATFTPIDELPDLVELPNNVILYGLDPNTHPDFPGLTVIAGNKTLEPGEVIISSTISSELNLFPGIRYSVSEIPDYGFSGVTVYCSGVIEDNSQFGNYLGFFFILIDLDYFTSLFSDQNYLNFHLVVELDEFIEINNIAARLDSIVGNDFYVYREKALSDTEILAFQSYQVAMNLIVLASFVVEFLFITNILTINVRERYREFGILRANGASTFQLVAMLSVEILFYSLIGSFFGDLLGIIISIIFVVFLNASFPQISINVLVLSPSSLISTFFTGIFLAFIAGLYPIFIASTMAVVQNIHWRMRAKRKRFSQWVYLILAGTLMSIIGIGTTYFIGPSRFLSFELISWHFFAVWATFLGIVLMEGGFLNFLPLIGSKLLFWHGKVPKTIASRNIGRQSQKSVVTIMVTALALSFILTIGIVSAAIIDTVPKYYDEQFGKIDIVAQTTDDAQVSISFAQELVEDNSLIERAAFLQQQRTLINNIEASVLGVNPETYGYFFIDNILLPADPQVAELLNASTNSVIISDLLLVRIGARIGENITVMTSQNRSLEVVIKGITSGNPFLLHGNYIYCSYSLFQQYWYNETANWFIMSTVETDIPLNTITDSLSNKYSAFSEVIGVDFYSQLIENSLIIQRGFFQVLFIHTFLLSGLAQFVSILVTTLNMEREVGILRALGLYKREVFTTFLAESTLLGISGVVIGVINGIIGSELLSWYISLSIPIQTSVTFNSPFIIYWALFSLSITIASTVAPSYRASRRNIANAINYYAPIRKSVILVIWEGWDGYIDDYLVQRDESVRSNLLRIFSKGKKKKTQ